MGGAGDNTVTITIQTVDASSGVISNVETKLGTLGATGAAAGAKVASGLKEAGAAGANIPHPLIPPVPPELPDQLNKVHGNMREVSGMAGDAVLNMGWSMRQLVAESPAAMTALRAVSGLFIGLAAAEIGAQAIEGVYHLYEKWFDVNKEVEAYQVKAIEVAGQKLLETASIEETIALLKQAQSEIDDLEKKRKAAHIGEYPGAGFVQYLAAAGTSIATGAPPTNIYSASDDENAAKAQARTDQATERQRKLQDEFDMQRLKGQAAYDSAADQGYAKIASHLRDETAQINLRSQQEQAAAKALAEKSGQFYDPKEGESKRLAAIAQLQDEVRGQNVAASKAEQQTIITAQNEATNSHLAGTALVQSQEEQAIDAVWRKFYLGEISKQGMIAESAAIWDKFEQQKLSKMDEERYATEKIQQTAAQAGLTGVSKIQAEGNEKVTDIWENPANKGIPDDEKQKRGIALEKQTDAEILAARTQFNQQMADLSMRADAQMEQGYARIEADAGRAKARITEEFSKGYGQLPDQDPERIAAAQRAQAAITNVDQNAQRERQQMSERDNQEIARINAETARASLPPWLAAQMAIREQFDETTQKAKADLGAQLAYFKQVAEQQHGLTTEQAAAQEQVWNQYSQRGSAEPARAGAEMDKQQEETRDKLAGALTSLFDNPAKDMEDRAKKLMMDILANWMMQLTEAKGPMGSTMAWIFGMNPEMSTSTNPKTALGSIFAPQHGAAGAAGVGGSSTLSAAGSTLSSAGSTLNAAGSTLSSSGTMLASAAQSLTSAAMAVGSMTAQASGGAGAGFGGGGGGLTPGGGTGDFTDAITTGMTNAINAPTSSSGVMGTPPGMSAGMVGQGSAALTSLLHGEIGRASCRERV